jgi:hypothetical protein
MNSLPCNFQKIEHGHWRCTHCSTVHARPSRRPPVRLCEARKGETPPNLLQARRRPPRPSKSAYNPPRQPPKIELGDAIANTLKSFGITPEKVTQWIGRPCGCERRREKLNQLDRWARQFLGGKKEEAEQYLGEIIDE